jgi:homoserine kinase type II
MAVLTPVSLADAQRIGAELGLDITACEGIPAGSVNSNHALRTARGERFFLRVYEEQTQSTARDEAALLAHLAERGVPTPRPLTFRSGESIGALGDKPVAVFPWVEGQSLCQARVSADVTWRVGQALARTHLAGLDYAKAPRSRFDAPALAARLDGIPARAPALAPLVETLRAELTRLTPLRSPAEAYSLVHADLFRDNVLFQHGELAALLDFESACAESRPFDLAVTLLSWCFGDSLDRDLARALVSGYVAVRPLPAEEVRYVAADTAFAALRFTITRITDFELRPRGAGVFKDYRRFLARLERVTELGDGLAAFLGLAP